MLSNGAGGHLLSLVGPFVLLYPLSIVELIASRQYWRGLCHEFDSIHLTLIDDMIRFWQSGSLAAGSWQLTVCSSVVVVCTTWPHRLSFRRRARILHLLRGGSDIPPQPGILMLWGASSCHSLCKAICRAHSAIHATIASCRSCNTARKSRGRRRRYDFGGVFGCTMHLSDLNQEYLLLLFPEQPRVPPPALADVCPQQECCPRCPPPRLARHLHHSSASVYSFPKLVS